MGNSLLLKSLPIKDLVGGNIVFQSFSCLVSFQPLYYEPESVLISHVQPRLLSQWSDMRWNYQALPASQLSLEAERTSAPILG